MKRLWYGIILNEKGAHELFKTHIHTETTELNGRYGALHELSSSSSSSSMSSNATKQAPKWLDANP